MKDVVGDRHFLRDFQQRTADAKALPAKARKALTGYVHSVETGGTLDGPGIRFVAFLQGCYFRCQYCHNPDTWKPGSGWHVTVDEFMEQIERYAEFLRKYDGGVTLSGGEPLVQPAFVAAILRRCKEMGLHTALDTNGSLGKRMTDEMRDDTDLFLLDLKSIEPATHKIVTGQPVGPVMRFARQLSNEGRKMWVRFVLVPGLTDGHTNVEMTARFAGTLEGVERVEVLPFHQMGAYKWEAMGLEYKLKATDPPDPALIARVKATFAAEGLKVV